MASISRAYFSFLGGLGEVPGFELRVLHLKVLLMSHSVNQEKIHFCFVGSVASVHSCLVLSLCACGEAEHRGGERAHFMEARKQKERGEKAMVPISPSRPYTPMT